MKFRILAATAVAAGLLLSMSGAEAAAPALDGKKVKVIKVTASGGLQDNTKTAVAGVDRMACTADCSRTAFIYAPAKGIKGGLMFTATWTNPLSDVDLHVGVKLPDGSFDDIGHCAGAGPTSEKVYIAPESLKKGKTYQMVMYYYRSVNDTFKGKIEINVPSTIGTTVPAKVDKVALINCTL